jgi:tetratricopeptide (TPR) repeat protein
MKSFGYSPCIAILVLLILLPCAGAQQTTPGGTGTESGGGTTQPKIPPSVPSMPPIIPAPKQDRVPQAPAVSETVYITGSVIQDDGSPPPFGTVIELDCGDTITREATVDSSGGYGFQVGGRNRIGRVMPDASDRIGEDVFETADASQNMGLWDQLTSARTTPLSVRLLRCEVRGQYPGYRSTSARMKAGSIWGYTEVAPILMYPITRVRGTSVSLTSLLAPKKARRSVERATKAMRKEQFNEAEVLLKSAIGIYPASAEAWFLLGDVYQLQKRNQEARESYWRAVQADDLYVRPYLRLARLSANELDWQNAAELSSKALELDPVAFPEAYYLNALALYNRKDLEAAEKSVRKGLLLDLSLQFPQMHLILANILSMKQDALGSIEEMRKYLKEAPKAEDAPIVRARLAEQVKLAKTEIK